MYATKSTVDNTLFIYYCSPMNTPPTYTKKNLPWAAPPTSLLYAYQNARCFYCNKYMVYAAHRGGHMNEGGYTIDHLFPRSKGFRKAGNCVLSCRRCNEIKGNRMPTLKEIAKAAKLYVTMGLDFILEKE